jgi:hypothetical protein
LCAFIGGCFGGINSTNKVNDLDSSDWFSDAKNLLTIPCWDPVNDMPKVCADGSYTSCGTELSTGLGICGKEADVSEHESNGYFHCTPSIESDSWWIYGPGYNTGGCNMWYKKVVDTIELQGFEKYCYDPASGNSLQCSSNHWQCETTFNGVGRCAGILEDVKSDHCTINNYNDDDGKCNRVNKGGCWNAAALKLSEWKGNDYIDPFPSVYCQTNIETGKTVETSQCDPNVDLCCKIVTGSQCNKIATCYDGENAILTCDATGAAHMCAIFHNAKGYCVSSDFLAGVLSFTGATIEQLSETFYVENVANAVIKCWNPSGPTLLTCGMSAFSCKVNMIKK